MKKMRLTICLLYLLCVTAGCQQRVVTIDDVRAAAVGIRSPIEVIETYHNPKAAGGKIYINLKWVMDHGLQSEIRDLLMHEDYHNFEIPDHCPKPECLMYRVYQKRGKTLCEKCRKLVKPTTQEWLENIYK